MPPDVRILVNPLVDSVPKAFRYTREPMEFHRRLPGYQATPLVFAPPLAQSLGASRVLVKWESERFGLPAFKMLGASWATYRGLTAVLGEEPGPWETVGDLSAALRPLRPFALAAATDGNHGRAVARMARWLGFAAHIFVPLGTATARIAAIESEGATVTVVEGDYDMAVARSAEEAGPRCLVVSDTSWPGYDDVPRWVIEGYSTLFFEVDDTLSERGLAAPDVLVVPIGVGGLASAAVIHWSGVARSTRPAVVAVEPSDAACAMASAAAHRITTVPGPHRSIMAGLNCGTMSSVAWPFVAAGIDAFVAIDDEWARGAMRDLAALGLAVGETGSAALAGITAACHAGLPELIEARLVEGTVLILCTEGVTDHAMYGRIVSP